MDADRAITTEMDGILLRVEVDEGDAVEPGDVVCTPESMKMENAVTAAQAGVVEERFVGEGDSVSADDLLFSVNVD